MTDIFDPEKRSEIMSRIRDRDTKPEMIVRRIAHGLGFRFRLHRRDLPGSPDLVFPRHRSVIMVHGCFWQLAERMGQMEVRLTSRMEGMEGRMGSMQANSRQGEERHHRYQREL